MKEYLTKAKEELKRVDHILYVSLKYTRTVDVMKGLIERLINAYGFIVDTLLEYAKTKKKLKEAIPPSPLMKCELVKKIFKDDERIKDNIEFYLLLRKIIKAKTTKREEYRRHVTMTAYLEPGKIVEVNTDLLKEYFNKLSSFLEYLEEEKLLS